MEGMRRISKNYYFRQIVASFLVGCMFFNNVPAAFAGPGGANIVAGSAAVGQGGNTTTVTMGSAQAVINWDSLNTNSNEILQFLKASGGFAVLNRVVQGGATQFDGSLFGNQGHILIVNPQGIVFGPTALVQAYKFTAAGLDISNEDFMNGHYQFVGGDGVGAVSNYGSISAEQVALIGKQVLNAGVISSPGGYVVMAAGDKVFLGQEGSNVLVEVEGVTVPAATDAAGIGDVINEGTIEAAGGKIVLAAGDTFSRAVEGLDSLSLAVESGSGRVGQFGTVNADGVEGDGGSITMTAGDVVALSSDSVTTANAGTNGDGGDVIAYSPDTALFREGAQIQAKGGSESGDGGFIEVSGKNHVEVFGSADASATNGTGGLFLIDPYNITVQAAAPGSLDPLAPPPYFIANALNSTVSDDVIESYLDAGAGAIVLIRTADAILEPSQSGKITQNVQIDKGAGTNATLIYDAAGDIELNAGIVSTAGTLNVDLRANSATGGTPTGTGSADINAAITTLGGSFTSSGVDFDNTGGIITTGGGAIAINHNGTVTLGADLNPGAGSMSSTATSINVASIAAEIQDAIDIAGGTTISVSAGAYDENLIVDKPDITLKSDPGDAVTLNASSGYVVDVRGSGNGFTLGGANGEGFTINSGTGAVRLVQLTNAPQDVEISWNEFDTTGSAQHGISIGAAGATDLKIYENDFISEGGDLSIWGPEMVGLTVLDNEFTVPGGPPATGWAIQFAGVTPGGLTGSSTITGNIIDDYAGGISVFNGEATSDLTISENDISGGTTGILLGQYVQDGHTPGDMTTVTVTANTLTGNTTGLKIYNGPNVRAGNFSITNNFFVNNTTGIESRHNSESATIYENSFVGGTTGVSNTGSLAMLNAEGNWWGAANGPGTVGPGSGVQVTAKVDYSPWLGIGTDGSGDPGFQMESPMTWWTDGTGYIQDAIDAASSGDRVNVVAGSYNESVNVNKQLDGLHFMGDDETDDSEIEGSLTLLNNDNWDGGTLGVYTESTGNDFDLTLNAVTDTGDHSLTLDTGDATTNLDEDVTVGGDLTLMSDTDVAADKTLDAGDNVILAADKTLTGEGALTVMADEDIILGALDHPGDVIAAGNLTLDAGESIFAYGQVKTLNDDESPDNINLYASGSTIHLYGNVTADVTDGGDIILHSHSVIDDAVTLTAGTDVTILDLLEAEGDLTIVATAGGIESADVRMKANGKTLSLTQNDSLNMENAFDDVINSDNTDLVADSDAGSFTETKAPRWQSIEAEAQTYILLDDSDNPGDITTNSLTTTTGDILITSNLGKVYANGPINSGNDVKITAKNESSDAIFLNADVDAVQDIWLNNNTWAYDGAWIDAGQDVRVGWNETQERYDPKTLTGDGELNVEADRHITLGGAVKASKTYSGDLLLKADAGSFPPGAGVGNMIAYGTITNPGGGVDIYSSDGTGDLWDDVIVADDLILHNNTVMKAAGKKLESTGDDVVLAGGKTLDSDYDLTILAYDDIILGLTNTANTEGSQTTGSAGDVAANGGDLILNAGDDIYAHGSLTSSGGSDVDITAVYDIRLYGPVAAQDNIYITALSGPDDLGTLVAYDSLTANAGEVDIFTNYWINLQGPVYAYTDLTLNADTATYGDGYIDAYDTLTAETGNILGTADDRITLMDVATAGGNITLDADSDNAPGLFTNLNDLLVHGLVAGGYIDLSAGDSTISIHKSANLSATADVDADGDIILRNNTETEADAVLDAGDDVILLGGKTLDGLGALTVLATDDIILGVTTLATHETTGDVGSPGNVTADGDLTLNAGDDIYAHGTLTTTSGGDIDLISADDTTYLWENVTAAGDIILHNNTEVKASGKKLDAIDDVVLAANKTLDSDYDLTIEADDDIILGVTNADDHWDNPFAGSGGNVSAAGDLTLKAVDDVYAHGSLTTTNGGDIDIYSSDDTTYLWTNVTSAGDIILHNSTKLIGDRTLHADDDVVLAAYKSLSYYGTGGTITLEAGDDIILGATYPDTHWDDPTDGYAGNVTSNSNLILDAGDDIYAHGWLKTFNSGNITATAVDNINLYAIPMSADAAGNLHLEADTGSGGGDMTAAGNLLAGGDIDIYSSDSTTYLNGDRVEAVDDITLHNDTELDGGALQRIEATTGKLYAKGSVHKTSTGDLKMFGGYNGPLYPGFVDYSVWTQDVTVDDGDLTIQGKATVRLDGSIYSKYDMWLTANYDGTPSTPSSPSGDPPLLPHDYLVHYSGTIQSLMGDVDLSAQGDWIYLDGGLAMPATYVSAGDDILIRDNTWVQYSRKLHADDDVVLAGGKQISANGALTIDAGDDIILGVDDVDNHASTPYLGTAGNVTARNDLILDADDDIYAHGDLISNEGSVMLYSSNYTTNLYADVTADENILLNNRTRLRGSGNQRVEATTGTLTANRDVDKTTDGDLELAGASGIILGDDVSTHDGDLIFEDAVTANGTGSRRNQTFDADGDDKKLWAWDAITKTTEGNLTLSGGQGDGYEIDLDGDVTVEDGDLKLGSLLSLLFGDDDVTVYDGGTLEASDDVKVYHDLHGEGDLTVIAGPDTIYLWGDTDVAGNLLLNANTEFEGWDDQYVDAGGTLTASGYLRKLNKLLFSWSDGSLYLHAGGDISLADYVAAATLDECPGHGGGVSIISDTGTIFTPDEFDDPTDTLNVPITGRSVDVKGEGIGVDLPYGPGKAAIVIKSADTLNLGPDAELIAGGQYKDYDLADYLAAIDALGSVGDFFAGVAGADFGTFLDGFDGFGTFFDTFEDYDAFMDALDAYCGGDIRGVIFGGDWGDYLAFKFDTAPDIFDSKPALGVDDRAGVNFLDAPGTYIPLPGGPLRDEGDPFDAAIYVASTTGNVDVSSPVSIMSGDWFAVEGGFGGGCHEEGYWECVPRGAMVIDAWNTVTFGDDFETSLAGDGVLSEVGDRLEVCSRITEWLFQAFNNGRLPYVYGGGPFPPGYDYVLRGAGLGNPGITDTRAWVLENPKEWAPLEEALIPGAEAVAFAEGGCPILMEWLAGELGIPEETIQVYLADTFLYSTAIQPCDACARLNNAATILDDPEGTRIAALAQVVNEFVAPDAPIAPEQMASIASAMVSPEAGTYYAAGGEWLDALAEYVSILNTEMGFSVPESVAFVGKYLTSVAELDNASLASYVEARLAALGG